MTISEVEFRFVPRPWQPEVYKTLGYVLSGGGEYAFVTAPPFDTVADVPIPTGDVDCLWSGLQEIAARLASSSHGELDLDSLLRAIPDRGTALKFIRKSTPDAKDLGELVRSRKKNLNKSRPSPRLAA